MPSDKRARQREGRQARQQALEEERRQRARRRRLLLVGLPAVVFIGLFIWSAQGGDESAGGGLADSCPAKTTRTTAFDKAADCIDPEQTYLATVKTNKGDFTITLDAEKAPKTVNNFVFLAQNRFYDGVIFHRIIPGFVVQGGDPQGTGQGGPGYQFVDELPEKGDYKVGSVAMANSGPDTNGSQFFIVTGDQGVALPPNYSLFGQVTAGMDVVKKLEAVGTPGAGTPSEEVKMLSVRVREK